ncbi:unnamed protein product [Rotaria sp. Silwood2]|nr:unnamed protein product [Rotaria sp. Silwood2]
MQIVFLQDDNDDLRKAMETTININAICAMSCFENQDFEGLKVAMRKMPNSQASYGWDMEAFDMLVTVETLKGVSKRRNLLHIAKWSRSAIESNYETTTTNVISLGKLFQLRKQYLITDWVLILPEKVLYEKIFLLMKLLIGELLDFSTLTCPTLAKSWFRFADWSYIWGRQLLARSISYEVNLSILFNNFRVFIRLSSLDMGQQVHAILPAEISSDEITEISRIISSMQILTDDDSELTAAELSSLHSHRTDLSRACSLLTKHPTLIEQLLALHPQFDLHRYFVLEQFCRAYFTYLQLTKDYLQLILYSVIVGITDDSKMRRIKSRDENIYQRKSLSTHGLDEDKSQNDIEEDDDIEQQENVVAMQNIKLFVHELRRVTVLWDELWLGTMAQLQEENSRLVRKTIIQQRKPRARVDVLKDELQRLESMTHLTKDKKEYLIKEKQDILCKSFITVLEAISQITRLPAETPRKKHFRKIIVKKIEAAIEQLKQPIILSNPHSCWLKLRQLYSMLHRMDKRSSTIHAMSQISPKLAQIKHSVTSIPGEDGQFHTIHSVGQTVQVLPTKTRPKKLMFVGSNGHRYQYLLKGLEDLHLDVRIMQLLSIINVIFTKINHNEPWSYEARNYTVVPLASRSGLIEWVEGGKPPVEDCREVPMPILHQCIEELIRETPADLLSRELWCSCPSVGLWYKNVQNYRYKFIICKTIC